MFDTMMAFAMGHRKTFVEFFLKSYVPNGGIGYLPEFMLELNKMELYDPTVVMYKLYDLCHKFNLEIDERFAQVEMATITCYNVYELLCPIQYENLVNGMKKYQETYENDEFIPFSTNLMS